MKSCTLNPRRKNVTRSVGDHQAAGDDEGDPAGADDAAARHDAGADVCVLHGLATLWHVRNIYL